MKLKILDLFSGIGGFSLGLEKTGGFETSAFCEIDKHAREILKKNWANVPILHDIKKLNTMEDIDIITGGFPCQDISLAGGRNGIKAERSGLWAEYCRIIKAVQPKYAIIENVEYLRKNGLSVVLNDLARIGYDAEWACIPARSVGYPHQRKRLFIISYPSGQRQHQYIGEGRQVQINEEWPSESDQKVRQGCESESIKVRPVLSRRTFENIRSTYADEGTNVSRVRRVTDGIPEGLDEKDRKQRIKQLGNSIIPRIAEIIGHAILKREGVNI